MRIWDRSAARARAGLQGGCGLEVCGAGAGKVSQTHAGAGGNGQKSPTRAGL